jgi:hypothetical protein
VVSSTESLSGDWSGEYWRSGSTVRIKEQRGNGVSKDVLVRDGQAMIVSRGRGSDPSRPMAAIAVADRTPTFNVWFYSLLAFNIKDSWGLELERLCARPYTLNAAKRVQENGKALIYADLTHDEFRHELWFDPQVNYLIRKAVVHLTPRQGTYGFVSTTVVKRFREVTPSAFFPEMLEGEGHYADGRTSNRTVKLSELSINEPLPNELWDFRFPSDCRVANHIDGIWYKVDQNGRLGAPVRDRAGKIMRVITAGDAAEALRASADEPISWTMWIAPASLGVLAIAAGFWLARRWQARRVAA